ncbi:PA14 domain-containing protein [Halodesulfovibrio sp.]|uniref:PA14 domain-containing protein n=1 Tax=Halodesulfovibrio sp. TaxID=1912772 RepID=UPI0025C16705|nr:PA14 domain-containing protein [Halodesulfovibrio sp.]
MRFFVNFSLKTLCKAKGVIACAALIVFFTVPSFAADMATLQNQAMNNATQLTNLNKRLDVITVQMQHMLKLMQIQGGVGATGPVATIPTKQSPAPQMQQQVAMPQQQAVATPPVPPQTSFQNQMPMTGQMPTQTQMPMAGQLPAQAQMPAMGQMVGQTQMPMMGQMPLQGQVQVQQPQLNLSAYEQGMLLKVYDWSDYEGEELPDEPTGIELGVLTVKQTGKLSYDAFTEDKDLFPLAEPTTNAKIGVLWEGFLNASEDGDYVLNITTVARRTVGNGSDHHVGSWRAVVFLDDQVVIDQGKTLGFGGYWNDPASRTSTGSVSLKKGLYPLKIWLIALKSGRDTHTFFTALNTQFKMKCPGDRKMQYPTKDRILYFP